MSSTPWGPEGLKRVTSKNIIIFQTLVIFGKIARTPAENKGRFLHPRKNIPEKDVNKFSVSKNISGETF